MVYLPSSCSLRAFDLSSGPGTTEWFASIKTPTYSILDCYAMRLLVSKRWQARGGRRGYISCEGVGLFRTHSHLPINDTDRSETGIVNEETIHQLHHPWILSCYSTRHRSLIYTRPIAIHCKCLLPYVMVEHLHTMLRLLPLCTHCH